MPKLKPITVLARCRGPGWVAHARLYRHERWGPFKIWRVAAADRGADVIFAGAVFDEARWYSEWDRENASKPKAPRRKGNGNPKRPPAAPRGGGKAA